MIDAATSADLEAPDFIRSDLATVQRT